MAFFLLTIREIDNNLEINIRCGIIDNKIIKLIYADYVHAVLYADFLETDYTILVRLLLFQLRLEIQVQQHGCTSHIHLELAVKY